MSVIIETDLMKYTRSIILAVILYLVGISFLFLTNPQHLALVGLVLPFIIFFAAFFISFKLLLRRMSTRKEQSRPITKQNLLAALLAGLPVLCLLLGSIGQFSFRDFVTLIILFAMLGFYVKHNNVIAR